MIETFYQRLEIPDSCFLGKRFFKKLFYENAPLNAGDKKAFSEDIEDIQWLYTLKPETINIARYEDDDREYHEIAILQVTLKSPIHYKRIAHIIQRGIPYPLLVVFVDQSHLAFSIADKRINRADREKIRVEDFYETDWMDLENLSEIEQDFIENCTIKQFSYNNFYEFYSDLTARIVALLCANFSGTYALENPLSRQERVDLHNVIRHEQQQLAELRASLKKESQFNRRLELNVQIKKLVQDLEQHKAKV